MLRARFVVVPLVVLGLPTAYVTSLAVSDALDAREERRAHREYERRVAPAKAALQGIRLDGLAPCTGTRSGACLTGRADVTATSGALDRALRDAGATGVEPRCRRVADRAFCTVRARLHGSDVDGTVGHVFVAREPTDTIEVVLVAVPAG